MKKKIKKNLLFGFGSLGMIIISASITTAIILPNALKAKNGLKKFVLSNSGKNNYNNFYNKKLFYVALGDSISSGYNGVLKRDSYSYADFLANNLRKANKLAGYKNFAISGKTIFECLSEILKNTSKTHAIQKADLISLSIGSNDILQVMKFLEIGFSTKISNLLNIFSNKKIMNIERKKININKNLMDPNLVQKKKYLVGDSDAPFNKGEMFYILRKSIHNFVKMYKNKDFSEMISLQEVWKDKIFDLIKRNIMMLIHDIYTINPNAKLIFVSPYFPFSQFPESEIKKIHSKTGRSIVEMYDKLIFTMKEAVEFSLDGNNNFVDFVDISKLKITKTISSKEQDNRDNKNLYFKDYIKTQQQFAEIKNIKEKDIPNYWKRNAFPNSLDIHPSIFGNQLIGNAIFSRIYNYFKVKNYKSEHFYTFTKPYNLNKTFSLQDKWTRIDESPDSFNINEQYFITNLLKSKGSFVYSLLKIINKKYPSHILINTMNKYLLDIKKLSYDDYIPLLELINDDKFIDKLVLLFDKRNEIWKAFNIINNSTTTPNVKQEEILKISNYLSFAPEETTEENKLFRKSIDKLKEMKKEHKNLKKLFEAFFEFLIKPSIITAFNIKNIM